MFFWSCHRPRVLRLRKNSGISTADDCGISLILGEALRKYEFSEALLVSTLMDTNTPIDWTGDWR